MSINLVDRPIKLAETDDSIVDLERIIEGICHDLHGQVDPEKIRQVVISILPRYQDAHVFTYIPILLQRDAMAVLRSKS